MENKKITIKFKELLEIANAIYELDDTIKDPLSLSIYQMKEYLKYPLELYNKEVEKINQTCCSLDKDGNFYLDDKNKMIFTKFNPVGMEKRATRLDVFQEKEVDLEVRVCEVNTRVKTLPIRFFKLLNNILFVISEDEIKEIYKEKEVSEGKKTEVN